MKIKIFVAFIATATIVFISCNWFRSKKKEVSNPLVGEWKLDSIKAGSDTGFFISSLMQRLKTPKKLMFLLQRIPSSLTQFMLLIPLDILSMKKQID